MVSGGHVLIIEDDDVLRLLETLALQRNGWEVSEASTGAEGIGTAAGKLPEVIICDRRLPDLDGLDVIAALASDAATASIPVVLVTGMGEADEIVAGIAAGAHDYLVKPFRMVELEVRCQAALRVSRQHRLLTRSEHELRALTENTTELVVRSGMDGLIRYVSSSIERQLGWAPAQLIGRPVAELSHPDDVAKLCALLAAPPGEVTSVISRAARAGGGYMWVESRAQVIDGPDGDPEILTASRDITERLAISAALTESEKAYRQIVDLAAEGVCVVDPSKTITFANARMGDLLGVTSTELVGRSMDEFTDEEGRAIEEARLERHRAGGSESGDSKFVRPDGTSLWTSFNAAPIFGDDGAFQGSIALICDVTERHDREQALRAAEKRWRTAFDFAPVGMAQIGVDSRFLRVNPALCDMLGYSSYELLAMMPVALSHPDDAELARQGIADLLANKIQHFRVEKRHVHADGHIVWTAVSAIPMYDIEGRVEHLLVHYLDISELKAVETELQHLAMHDPLTGLLNRRGFDDALGRHVAYSNRYGPQGAVLVLDIDGLKHINDTRGHNAGDRAIATVAGILRHRLRSTDTLARLGGDEFAVILPNADRQQSSTIAAALVETVRSRSLADDAGEAVTVSVGVALFEAGHQSPECVMSAADGAMYAAKSAGRDRWALSSCQPVVSMASAMNRARKR